MSTLLIGSVEIATMIKELDVSTPCSHLTLHSTMQIKADPAKPKPQRQVAEHVGPQQARDIVPPNEWYESRARQLD
jgi:hypothetical protein